jgi:hypothetical protein
MAFVVYAIKMYFNDDFNEETAPEKKKKKVGPSNYYTIKHNY